MRLGGDGNDVGIGAGRSAEGFLECLDDLGVRNAVEKHFVYLVEDFFWEPGDFAATGAEREWVIGFVG